MTSELAYLLKISSPYLAVNGQEYYKIAVRCNTGYDFKMLNLVCFNDISGLEKNSKVKLELNGYKLKSIEPADFIDCPDCKAPISSLYEALSCSHGSNNPKTYIDEKAELLILELNKYKHGNGYKIAFKIDEDTKYSVIFENSPFFNIVHNANVGEELRIKAWLDKGNLMKICDLY